MCINRYSLLAIMQHSDQLAMSSYLSIPMVLPLFVFLIPFTFFLLIKQKKHNAQLKCLPSGPRRLPLIGNLHLLFKDLPQSVLEHLANKFGPFMFLQLGSRSTLVVSSAQMAREVFSTHDLIFSDRPRLYGGNKLSYNSVSLVFSPYGEQWREIRKIVISELLSPKRVQMFHSMRDEEVGVMIDSITHNSKGLINLNEVSLHLANNIVCRCAFGRKFDGAAGDNSNSTIHELLEETRILLGGFFVSDYLPWMGWLDKFSSLEQRADKCFKGLDNICDKVIEEHSHPERVKPEPEDLVDVLLRVQKDPNQAISLTNDQMKAVITDMFIGGTDTTTSTLVWTMAELMRHPVALMKAQNEVRGHLKNKGKVEESDLPQLMYLKSVIKEGLRLHPPLPLLIPRQTTESCTIGDYHIPAKTMVLVHAKMIGRDPKAWENPNEFRPERFLDNSVDYKGNHCFLPFGIGRRSCPGMDFAVQVIELALANFLYRFDWELPHGMNREDLDMKEAAGLIVHKKVQLCLAATPIYL